MHCTDEKKPAGSVNFTASDTDTTMASDTTDTGKVFVGLVTRFALVGHSLTRTNPADSAAIYHAARWGLSGALPDLQAAAHFLAQIGGAA